MSSCSFRDCDTISSDKRGSNVFAFPLEDKENLKKWVEAIGKPEFCPTSTDFLCSKHFASNCITNGILKPTSVPDSDHRISANEETGSNDFDLCRICGRAKDSPMIDIFDASYDICEMINTYLPFAAIAIDDNKPLGICEDCLKDLKCIDKLEKNSRLSEEKWNEIEESLQEFEPISLTGAIFCDICEVHFNDTSLFDEHMLSHEEKPSDDKEALICCSSCGHVFPDWATHEEHRRLQITECSLCSAKFLTECRLHKHICKKFKCKTCGLMLSNELQLQTHIKQTHTNENRHNQIKKIGRNACSTNDIKPNIITGRGGRRNRNELYSCSICNIVYESNKKLRAHFIDCHGTSNVNWICRLCGKSMTTKVSLQIHERIHLDTKPYICNWCGKSYRSRANLNQHQVVHTGVRNHECSVCGKRFSRKAFVTTHMRVHTGERPFACDICGQRFTQHGDMKRHRHRHEYPNVPAYPSDRVYACDFCGAEFAHITMLKTHRKEHLAQ